MLRCPKCGTEVRPKPKRSGQQNRYYWLYLGVIAQETGDNADDLHELFKRKLLPPKFITVRGEEVKIPASTTDLSKGDFIDYLDKICALTGVPIPDPEAAGFISNYKPPVTAYDVPGDHQGV